MYEVYYALQHVANDSVMHVNGWTEKYPQRSIVRAISSWEPLINVESVDTCTQRNYSFSSLLD